jgi:hypothetical protein
MLRVFGGCHCGNLRIEARLTGAPESYNPRECDCEFCRKHGAAYVSDPQGKLSIVVSDPAALTRYRQGNALAEMLICRQCGVLAGALFAADGQLFGAVNVQALEGAHTFGARQAVSPRKLNASEKTRRWQDIWFPNVSFRS